MRKAFIILILFPVLPAIAQKKLQYEVNTGEVVGAVITNDEAYQYTTFKPATIALTTGQVASSPINYHALFGEMHFISSKGDTMAVGNESSISYLAAETDTFYYHEGFVLQLASNKDVKLVKRERIILAEKLKSTGGYGNTSSSGVESVYGIASAKVFKTLVASEKMVFAREKVFYFRDKDNQLTPAVKANLLKLYKQNKKAVEQYLSDNPVSFTKEDDLKRLIAFLNSL
jgi:hypothetical protein